MAKRVTDGTQTIMRVFHCDTCNQVVTSNKQHTRDEMIADHNKSWWHQRKQRRQAS